MKLSKKIFIIVTLIIVSVISSLVFKERTIGVFSNTRNLPIYSVDIKEKKIALTFDVSWGKDNTDEILDILDKYNVKASFFLVGGWIDMYPELVKKIYDKGHELGNHTDKHPDLTRISRDKIISEISINDAKIMNLTGFEPKIFRCPSGSYNSSVIKTIEATGHYAIQWDVDSIDWREEGGEVELNRVLKKAKPGSIILFHNNAKNTPGNLPKIIEYFKKSGYQFVKVGDLIYKNNYYMDQSGKQYNNN